MGNFIVPSGLLTFSWVCVFLAFGLILRSTVKPFQKALIPSCILGGVAGLIALNAGWVSVNGPALSGMTYHFFALSFMSLGLAGQEKQPGQGGNARMIFRASIQFALLFLVAVAGQSFVGGGISYLMHGMGADVFPQFGTMVAAGFAMGPGQAVAVGKIWEASGMGNGVEQAQAIGIIFASLGFLMAFGVGVPLANWGIKRKLARHLDSGVDEVMERGLLPSDAGQRMGLHTTHPGNIDTLAVHFMLLGICYLLSYLLADAVGLLIGRLPIENAQKWVQFSWGMFFLYGIFVSSAMRLVMEKVGWIRIVNTELQNRITGTSVDFLIVCTLMSVNMAVVARFIVPIAVISLVVTAATLAYVFYFCRRYERDQLEQMLAVFGTVTGTAATGVLLVRLVDPNFRTPAAYATGSQNFFCLPVSIPCMTLWAAPFTAGMSMGMELLALGAITLGCVVALYALRLVGKPAW